MVSPPKTDVFETATLLGQITLFNLSSSGEYHIYIHTYMCINCCLIVEPKYLEQFCHQKRLQTFANESRGPKYLDWLRIQDSRSKIQDSRSKIQDSRFKIQDPRFKIQDPKKNSWIPRLGLGEFLDSRFFFESWILDLESWILNLGSWILDLESWASLNTWAPGLGCKYL
jgi:hypothetical protein